MALDQSLFIADGIEERTVELADGTKHVLHFKHLPNNAFERYAAWVSSDDEDVRANAAARLLAVGMCDPDGKPVMTAEQADRLKRPVMLRLMTALHEVNGFGRTEQQKADQQAELGNG